ncbi:MAG: YHYH domain-containing protein [Planctomycetaceae bacterium]|nr:YHYH domain-containing protein [Planctomycetaceae bacterium]MCB9953979.1 YHYH domain-containing protein [Planctomycetaceae bacterium]
MRFLQPLPLVCLFIFCADVSHAHPGGLDSQGGHNDRKNGGYHFHRSSSLPTTSILPTPRTAARTLPRTEARVSARLPTSSDRQNVVVDVDSGIFHLPTCRLAHNSTQMSRAAAIARYEPCEQCKPAYVQTSSATSKSPIAQQADTRFEDRRIKIATDLIERGNGLLKLHDAKGASRLFDQAISILRDVIQDSSEDGQGKAAAALLEENPLAERLASLANERAESELRAGKNLMNVGQKSAAIIWFDRCIESAPDSKYAKEAKMYRERIAPHGTG